METNDTNNYLLKKQIRKEAMKRISGNYALTNEMLHLHWNEIDWKELSSNITINWTSEILDHWKDEINWHQLSQNSGDNLLIGEFLERFKDYWDWKELSDNSNFKISYELIDKYIDRWDWNKLINRYFDDDLYSMDFYLRYQKYIPMDKFEDSLLWEAIVAAERDAIEKDLIMGK